MVQSNTQPQNIQVDWGKLKHGKVDILVHWNVEEVEHTDPMTEESITYYTYDECRMKWVLPSPMTSKVDIQTYFDNNYDQGEKILDWAKASKINESCVI